MRPRVLLAQDDPALRDELLARLGDDGVSAQGVSSGAELLALTWAALEDPRRLPELIIADLRTPGAELLELLESLPRQVLWKVPIILVSHDPEALIAERARRIGCAVVVPRPLQSDELRQLALALLPRELP